MSLSVGSSKLLEESSCSLQKGQNLCLALSTTTPFCLEYSPLCPWVARKVAPSGKKKDKRITSYHNASIESDDGSGASSDFLEILLVKAKTKPSILINSEVVETLLIEIGMRLFMFQLKSEDDSDVSVSLASLGLDSLVGVEMRSWWCQTIGLTLPFSRCWA